MITDSPGQSAQLLLGIRGMDSAAFSRTVLAPLLGTSVRMIGIDDFVAMKIFAGAARDLDDVRGVLRVSRDSIRLDLVKQLTAQYGLREISILEELLAE